MRLSIALALFACVGCGSKAASHKDMGGVGGNGPTCGDGVVDPSEQCDDGMNNGTPNDPCTAFCNWRCSADATCDDKNPCNGAETCTNHVCAPGTAPADGTSCGSGMLCHGGSCDAAKCGDGIVTPPEECDDGNNVNGDGCDNNCKFSCVTSDPTRNCTPADSCQGQGKCSDATHVCSAGTPLPDNTMCMTGHDYCKSGMCTVPVCGNGVVEPGEMCDDGGLNGTKNDPCNAMCGFACSNPLTDCGAAPKCEKFSCTTMHTCQAIADPTQNGNNCGTGLVCKNGACGGVNAVCGNGIIEAGEQCDFGAGNNGSNTGCDPVTCQFSCQSSTNCDDGNPCNGAETCDPVTVNGHAGQKCDPGTPPAKGTTCGTGKICLNNICNTSTCGDGFVDPNLGETCDPPNGTTCDGKCHIVKCGDGIRAPASPEQCDDGNTTNLDGCDDHCLFEQNQRANSLSMSWDTKVCATNALGKAIVDTIMARPMLLKALTSGIADGSITIAMKFLGLDDLKGTKTTAPFSLGFMHGSPVAGTGYNGASDLDWWYTVDMASLDGNRNPTDLLTGGAFNSSNLTTTPGTLNLVINLVGSVAKLTMYNSVITAVAAGPSANQPGIPLKSAGTTPPGHVGPENLDPTLASFPALTGGKLCGDISAGSLYTVDMPTALISNCIEKYTTANHLLDAIVNGCNAKVLGFNILVISKTQPDGSTDGQKYQLQVTGNTVTGCNVGGAFPACLDNAWYSSAFQFTTDRVIGK
jgi:cysteine-rich repeat protein